MAPLSSICTECVCVRECVRVCLRASVKETESTMRRGRIFEYKDLICRHSWRKLDVSASANKRPRWSRCRQLYEENARFDSGERVTHTAESEVRFKDWWKNVLFREAFCEFLQGFCMLFFLRAPVSHPQEFQAANLFSLNEGVVSVCLSDSLTCRSVCLSVCRVPPLLNPYLKQGFLFLMRQISDKGVNMDTLL